MALCSDNWRMKSSMSLINMIFNLKKKKPNKAASGAMNIESAMNKSILIFGTDFKIHSNQFNSFAKL